MIKKTFKELNRFTEVLGELLQRNKDLKNTKFGYACKRFEEVNLKSIYTEFNKDLAFVRIDHAITDPITGALLQGPAPRNFQYTKEGLKDVIKEEQKTEKFWATQEFEIEPYICKEENIPIDLTEEELEVFKGLVI